MNGAMWADLGRPLTSAEMEVVEANAGALGVSVDALMERAGRAIAEEAARHLPPAPAPVAILAGSGNNGGDGTCAAHYLLEWGYRPELWLVRPASQIYSHAARRCYERVAHRLPVHVGIPTSEEIGRFPLAIDALLGTGQSGPLRAPYSDAVRSLTQSGVPALAVDLATGARDPAGLVPKWTVALTVPKAEMDPAQAGDLSVRDIGIPSAAWAETGPGEFLFYPSAELAARGRHARVVVIGGGPYAGAPALAGMAALRAGAERATVLAPGGAAEQVQAFGPNLVVHAVGQRAFAAPDVASILHFLEGAPPQAIVLGMGAGSDRGTLEMLGALEAALAGRYPMVVDAEALQPLPASRGGAGRGAPIVATPNAGEFGRHFAGAPTDSPEKRRHHAASVASRLGVTLVVKGDPDLLTDGTMSFENRHHSPYQTVAGAGDVLGGILGTLLALGINGLHAARLATYWVGDAGLRAAGSRSAGVLATDLIEELPATLVAGLGRVRHAE